MKPYTAWRVVISGRTTGFIETSYAWAAAYWRQRARDTNRRIKLVGFAP